VARLLAGGAVVATCALSPIPAQAASAHVWSAGSGDSADRQYKPRVTLLSGDGTLEMRRSQWTTWTSTEAVGHGVGVVDSCNRGCANGPFRHVPMRLRESNPKRECGRMFFTTYHVTFARRPFPNERRRLTLTRDPIACNG
jgi:hypothetical protein